MVLSEIELIFLIEACIMFAVFWICDDSSGDNTTLFSVVAEQCLYSALCCPAREEVGSSQEVGKARTAAPDWPKRYSIPHDVMIKEKGKEGGREDMLGEMEFTFPRDCYMWWALLSWSSWWVVANEFLFLLCLHACFFLDLVNCLYLTNSLTFIILMLFPISPGESEQVTAWYLVAYWS